MAKIEKQRYRCEDGPLAGKHLYLSSGSTIVFTHAGKTGRYRAGFKRLDPATGKNVITLSEIGSPNNLYWEPKACQ